MNMEEEIRKIQKRNRRVEADKAWEISWTRRIIIGVVTYFVVMLWLYMIESQAPFWLNALVPAVAFVLSTLSMPILKRRWIRNRKG